MPFRLSTRLTNVKKTLSGAQHRVISSGVTRLTTVPPVKIKRSKGRFTKGDDWILMPSNCEVTYSDDVFAVCSCGLTFIGVLDLPSVPF